MAMKRRNGYFRVCFESAVTGLKKIPLLVHLGICNLVIFRETRAVLLCTTISQAILCSPEGVNMGKGISSCSECPERVE